MGRNHSMDSKILGSNIIKYRTGKGLTQEAVAELTGLSVNYYRQIELGNKTPQLKTFITIAETLEAPADKLLEGILVIKDIERSNDIVSSIYELPATKRKLVLAQIESLLDSLETL